MTFTELPLPACGRLRYETFSDCRRPSERLGEGPLPATSPRSLAGLREGAAAGHGQRPGPDEERTRLLSSLWRWLQTLCILQFDIASRMRSARHVI